MPNDGKVCTFDCLYCEAGYNAQGTGTTGLPTTEQVLSDLRNKLIEMRHDNLLPDVITFSGNGEPTLHPDFLAIIKGVIALRNEYAPEAKVSVLTNATRLDRPEVVEALHMVDNNILKLDSAVESTMRRLDRPTSASFTVAEVVDRLRAFSGEGIIQTLLVRGVHDGKRVDNTTEEERAALLEAYLAIDPKEVMVYSIDRSTPEESLEKVPAEELKAFAFQIESVGIRCVTA
jgi:wyosine [tRNA(Phe)-imidazoG37] synthetase (radical SAM superfamily)